MKGSIFLVAVILVAIPATPVFAKTIKVPKDYDSIQDAIDAAADGDKIVVKKGVYRERVEVLGRNDLMIQGAKGAVIDKNGFIIENSTGITVKGLTLDGSRTVGFGITDSDDVTISGCVIMNTVSDGIDARRSDRLRIEKNVLDRIDEDGIDLNYEEGAMEGCDDAVISGNRITMVDSDAIEISGQRAVVTKNVIEDSPSEGIHIQETATDALISKNRIDDCHNGILTRAPRTWISKNRVNKIVNDGVGVTGDAARVDKNRISDCEDDGVDVWMCVDCIVEKNRISDIHEEGIQIGESTGGTYAKNRIKDCDDCGIIVESGNGTFEKNRIKDCDHCGILMRDGGSEVVKNRIKGSGEVDIWDGGSFPVPNVYEKNRYQTSNLPD